MKLFENVGDLLADVSLVLMLFVISMVCFHHIHDIFLCWTSG